MAWYTWRIKLKVFLVAFLLLSVTCSGISSAGTTDDDVIVNINDSNDHNRSLKPCFKPKVSKNKLLDERWFKSGHLYSHCTHAYKNSSRDITSCVSVCTKQFDMTQGAVSCDSECKTQSAACKRGCDWYNAIFHNTRNRTLNATRIPSSSKPIKIQDERNTDDVSLKWEHVYSRDQLIRSIYVVTIKMTKDSSKTSEYILGLTESTNYTITTTDMKSNMYSGYMFKTEDMTFTIQIYPLNFNGPLTVIDSKRKKLFGTIATAPQDVTPVQGLRLNEHSPYYNKDEEQIVWELGWNSTSVDPNRSMGIRFIYKLDSCTNQEHETPVTELNFPFFGLDGDAQNGYCAIKVKNKDDDALRGCKIKVKMWVKYGKCFLSKPSEYLIAYKGCHTVRHFTGVCGVTPPELDTTLKRENVNVTQISHACEKGESYVCRDDPDSNCFKCTHALFNVTATWNVSDVPYEIRSIKLRYGVLSGDVENMTFIKQDEEEKIIKLASNATSYTLTSFSPSNLDVKKYGFQIFADTPYSKLSWKFSSNIVRLNLVVKETRVKSHIHDGETQHTVMVTLIVVAVILLAIAGILWKVRRGRNSSSSSSTLSDKVFMTSENGAVISDEWEINPHHIKMIEPIGEGAFGKVYSATITTSAIMKSNFAKRCGGALLLSDKTKTAIKFLKDGVQDEEIKDFKEEIALMKNIGYHKNIVNIIGSCTVRQPLCLAVEYMPNGNLLDYLRDERNKRLHKAIDPEASPRVAVEDLMSYAWQISKGMEFLESKNVVHRDLAARNILVGHNNLVKISDFGLSRQYSHEPIYIGKSLTRKLPLKWMSVEAIFHKEFTSASDVWSFGVVLFEIVTFGGTPYPFIGHRELCKLLKSGYRMEKPENCGQELYDVMCHCWNAIANQRPTFTELREHFEEIIEKGGDRYFSFDIDVTKAYYNVASFKSIPTDDEDDVLDDEYDPTQVQVKPLESVKAVDVAVHLEYGENSKLHDDGDNRLEETDDETERYISPQSLKSDHMGSPPGSYDNQDFHFNE